MLFLFREPIASIYTQDKSVVMLTAHFLLFAIFFQVSDAIQAPIQGILRGYKDVKITFYMSIRFLLGVRTPNRICASKFFANGCRWVLAWINFWFSHWGNRSYS